MGHKHSAQKLFLMANLHLIFQISWWKQITMVITLEKH